MLFDVSLYAYTWETITTIKQMKCSKEFWCSLVISPFCHPCPIPFSIPSQPLICFPSLYISFCSHKFYKNEIMHYILHFIQLLSLSIVKIHSCHSMYRQFISFYCWVVFHCTDIPKFVYLFNCSWIFVLFPVFSHGK